MEDKRNFKGVWIPKEVWLDESLTITEKCLLVEIDSLDHSKEGGQGCFKSNEAIGKFLSLSSKRVSNMLTDLKKRGYVEQIAFDGKRRYLSLPRFGKADTPDSGKLLSQIREHSNTVESNSNGKSIDLPSIQNVIDSNTKIIGKCPKSVGGKQVKEAEAVRLVAMMHEFNATRGMFFRMDKLRKDDYKSEISADAKACRQLIEIHRNGYKVDDFFASLAAMFEDPFHKDNKYKYITPEYASRFGIFQKYSEVAQSNDEAA